MNANPIVIWALFFAAATADILFLQRRLKAKVRAGEMSAKVVDKKISYQWRLLVWVILLCIVAAIGEMTRSR